MAKVFLTFFLTFKSLCCYPFSGKDFTLYSLDEVDVQLVHMLLAIERHVTLEQLAAFLLAVILVSLTLF